MKTKLLFFTLVLLALGGSLCAQQQNVKGTFGSGAPGASTPCSKIGDEYTDISASQQYVATAITQSSTVTSCTWTVAGGSSSSSLSGTNVIDTTSSKYATPIGHTIPDATFTSGAATIDCTFSNDCNFVAGTDNGSVCFGTNFTTDVSILNPTSVVLARGLLTVTGAQTATCSGGNSTATTVHNGTFVWGKLGHTQLASAYTDCMAQNGCVLLLPAGPVLVESGVGNADCVKCLRAVGYGSIQVRGWGQTISQLIPTPSFDSASCNGGPSGDLNGCFFSGTSIQMSDFGIFGAGQAAIGAGFNGKVGIIVQGGGGTGGFANSYLNSLLLASWGATTTGFVGLKIEQESDTTAHDVHHDGFGNNPGVLITNCGATNSLTTYEGSYAAVVATTTLQVTCGYFSSHGGVYGWVTTGPAIICSGTAVCDFKGDTIPYQVGGGQSQLNVQNTAIANLDGVTIVNAAASSFGVSTFNGGTLNLRNVNILSNATNGTAVIAQNNGVVHLEGGNVFNAGGGGGVALSRTGTGKIFFDSPGDTYTGVVTQIVPACAATTGGTACNLVAGSTNEKGTVRITASAVATGTVTLTFAGTFNGATNTTPACNFSYANTGSAAWSLTTTTPITLTTRSNTAPVFNWNQTGALTAASTYDIDYSCTAR